MPNPTTTTQVSKPVAAPTKPSAPATPVSESKPSTFTFNKGALKDRLDAIIKFQLGFSGKVGHNPHMWIKSRVTPLYNRLVGIDNSGKVIQPEATQELHNQIMALPLEEAPTIKTLSA